MKRGLSLIILLKGILIAYLLFFLSIISKYDFNPTSLIRLYKDAYYANKEIIPPGIIVHERIITSDNQAYYIIALDINGEISSIKWESFHRSERILLPLLVNILSFGNKKLIIYIFPLLSFLMILISSIFLYLILKDTRGKIYFPLIYAINPGFLISFQHSFVEILSISLIVIGIFFLLKKNYLYILFFSLSAFAKSSIGVVFIGSSLIYYLFLKDYRNLFGFLASLLPYILYQFFLFLQINQLGFFSQIFLSKTGGGTTDIPFRGIIRYFLNFEFERKGIKLLYECGVIPFIIFLLFCFFVSLHSLSQNILAYSFFIWSLMSLTLSYEGWSTVGNSVRYLTPLFAFFILNFIYVRDQKIKNFLVIFLIFLSILCFIRAVTMPKFSYFLS